MNVWNAVIFRWYFVFGTKYFHKQLQTAYFYGMKSNRAWISASQAGMISTQDGWDLADSVDQIWPSQWKISSWVHIVDEICKSRQVDEI